LERQAGRNVEMMWLTGRLVPTYKTIADLRKDNGRPYKVCTRFVRLCREIGLLAAAIVTTDGSKFKAVNNRDRSVARHLELLDTADRQEPSDAFATKLTRLRENIAKLGDEMRRLAGVEARCSRAPISRSADRSRWALDGDERARLRRGRL
jgi:hypothetical protein